MTYIPAGTTVSLHASGTNAPVDSSHQWEVSHSGTLVGSSTTPNGWLVSPTSGRTDWFDITVPAGESPSATDTEYEFRIATTLPDG